MDSKHYQEHHDSTASSEGKTYRLNILFDLVKDQKPIRMDVSRLDWILPYTLVDQARLKVADLSTPILAYHEVFKDRWIVIDGAHRLTKAVRLLHKTILTRVVDQKMLDAALIKSYPLNKPLFTKW